MPPDSPAEPWLGFITTLDDALDQPTDFHCIGGFVVSQYYGFSRETTDLHVLAVVPGKAAKQVAELAGKGSRLQKKHRVYVDQVTVANCPEDYQERLVRAFPIWSKVRLWALEPHDLSLTKLERSNDKDIRDVMFLAQAGLINRHVLIKRFEEELEPFITGRTPTWNRATLDMLD